MEYPNGWPLSNHHYRKLFVGIYQAAQLILQRPNSSLKFRQ
jgi:hypothetical protein